MNPSILSVELKTIVFDYLWHEIVSDIVLSHWSFKLVNTKLCFHFSALTLEQITDLKTGTRKSLAFEKTFYAKMATPATMRQLEERQVDRAINCLLWSPRMDILAVVSETNDVSLFRLNWQRVSFEISLLNVAL